MTIQIRLFEEPDLEPLVGLLNTIDAADQLELGTFLDEKREYLSHPDLGPRENMFVAQAESGQLVAWSEVRLSRDRDMNGFRTRMEVHPQYRGQGLEDLMLARMEQRARERLDETGTPQVYIDIAIPMEQIEVIRAAGRTGMREVRRLWRMLRPNLGDLPTPRFPQGLTIRAFHMGEDDARVLDADNAAFSEHFGYTPETLETYQHYLHKEAYRPELSVLAIDPVRDVVAGFCHIAISKGECERLGKKRGWIDILAVRQEYRRRGLGEALILQGMHNLHSAGIDEAVLGCDSENTTNATALYFRTGFHVHKVRILYSKLIREPVPVQ